MRCVLSNSLVVLVSCATRAQDAILQALPEDVHRDRDYAAVANLLLPTQGSTKQVGGFRRHEGSLLDER
jgi:hypothetical protein